jgi:DMSO/TMAO reductase YedYZ molybdopterin-dependent catalytic subunit
LTPRRTYNRTVRRALLGVFVLAQSAGAAAPADPHALAQALQTKIKDFDARFKAGKPPREKRVVVSEAELTAYLNLAARIPPSVSNLAVEFDRDRIEVKGLLDLDQLQGKLDFFCRV